MPSLGPGPDWAIERIPPDDRGLDFYLKEYKPFRLTALQQDPDAFGSTYAREVAFTDEDWRKRLSNPIGKTFVVVQLPDRRILAATSLWGPMPNSEPLSNPNVATAVTNPQTLENTETPLTYHLTGVYTRAEARGRGFGQAVVKIAVDSAHNEARRLGRECRLGVEVYATNTVAISFYEKCGFVTTGPRPADEDTEAARQELLMHYRDATRTA
ncbi:hypothetical protein BKA67DRAFT_548434 [Truncatella angustata]|uniref:N-acetyltransferase domain-containing protein n=1 Tax=Truncatella angustata TaxID=152316 RepID=A0A9P9A4S0_9PEZI|nr:uncharacterized protein BKA67DRAFT_548434 [Truncatella angustata]KAH6660560.1 hypothetical protein BKA67DRAFT_548434 [Truncatella angustata]